jgi:hypothetical protein
MWTRESSLSAGSPDQSLSAGQSIWSPNGAYELIMQTDGNLVEYGSSGALWATGTSGSNNHVTMQTDGNLVIYSSGCGRRTPAGTPAGSSSTCKMTATWSSTACMAAPSGTGKAAVRR